jgi:ATP-binding cassette subfamily B protein
MSDRGTDFAALVEDDPGARNPVVELFARYGRNHLGLLTMAVVAQTLLVVLVLAPPYLLGVAVDLVAVGPESFALPLVPEAMLPDSQVGLFYLTFALLFGTAVLAAVFHLVRYFGWHWFHEEAKHDVRVDVYETTQRLGLDFFATTRTGEVMSVVNNDVNQLDALFHRWPADVLQLVFGLLALAGIMLYLHPQFALLTISVTLPAGLLGYALGDRIEPHHATVRDRVGKLNARIENSISGITAVKAHTNEEYERARVRDSSSAHRDASWTVTKLNAIYQPAIGLFTEFSYVFVFIVGGWWAVFGPPLGGLEPLSIGVFVTFFFFSQQFANRSRDIGDQVDGYYDLKASATRITGLLRYPVSITDAPDAAPLEDVDGRVAYEDVTFRYPGTDAPALRDVSVEVDAGEFVGVVGPTGAGKTTLMKLLVRFYDPETGAVRVDGTDVRDVTVDSLRDAVGYVSQEPFLFDDTVRGNIAYANREATTDAVVSAAERANAHGFIEDLPDGYDTRVGERGTKLSGGQRQRIAIARAILADPPILLLDEATSHVDNRTELLIQESLADLTADRTTFAIAHSLSTVRRADQLLVLEDWAVVERGTHDDLVAEDGLYAALWAVHVGRASEIPSGIPAGGGGDGD